jgi:hypothetical protein
VAEKIRRHSEKGKSKFLQEDRSAWFIGGSSSFSMSENKTLIGKSKGCFEIKRMCRFIFCFKSLASETNPWICSNLAEDVWINGTAEMHPFFWIGFEELDVEIIWILSVTDTTQSLISSNIIELNEQDKIRGRRWGARWYEGGVFRPYRWKYNSDFCFE